MISQENPQESKKIRDNEVVRKTKYPGVQTDYFLKWKEQIKAVSSKFSRAVGFIRSAKSFIPKKTLLTLHTGIVEPHFQYCCSKLGLRWSNLNQSVVETSKPGC